MILVGVDDTVTSLRAGWYAAGLARRQGAKVTIVFVAPVAPLGAATPGGAELAAVQRESVRQTADDLRRRVAEGAAELGISISFIVAEIRADAVVVGASAKAGHRLIGSLAVRLVRAGRWPVTVVP